MLIHLSSESLGLEYNCQAINEKLEEKHYKTERKGAAIPFCNGERDHGLLVQEQCWAA